ncbi:MAG: zinc ribbon domain-containing protein [Treponema sp.]|jgi:uncharacterized membrane protein YvbJ|nr:zinc ribbon domain-containing protein [Treponema sp.]
MRKKDSKKAKFFCESCGSEVPANSKFCPTCGKFFASVRCPKCGKTGFNEEFKNGCPNCGYAVHKSSQISTSNNNSIFERIFNSNNRKNSPKNSFLSNNEFYGLPAWIYIITFFILTTLIICLYLWLYS